MENFNFKLQRVLDFRISLEDKKKDEFVNAQKSFLNEKKYLDEIVNRKNSVTENAVQYKTGYEFQSYARFVDLMDNQIEKQNNKVTSSENELNQKKKELVESISDRKVLEMLKENAFNEFNTELNKKEQRFNDDFALHSYIRNERR